MERTADKLFTHPDISQLSFEDFYRTYKPYMKSIGLKLTDEHTAEEIEEDIALKLYCSGTSYYNPSKGSILPYIGRMVRNRCTDRFRASKPEEPTEIEAIDSEHYKWYGYADAADEWCLNEELLNLVNKAKKILYERLRSKRNALAYEMVYFKGIQPSEVAEELGMTVGNVYLSVFRCNEMMKGILLEMLE